MKKLNKSHFIIDEYTTIRNYDQAKNGWKDFIECYTVGDILNASNRCFADLGNGFLERVLEVDNIQVSVDFTGVTQYYISAIVMGYFNGRYMTAEIGFDFHSAVNDELKTCFRRIFWGESSEVVEF